MFRFQHRAVKCMFLRVSNKLNSSHLMQHNSQQGKLKYKVTHTRKHIRSTGLIPATGLYLTRPITKHVTYCTVKYFSLLTFITHTLLVQDQLQHTSNTESQKKGFTSWSYLHNLSALQVSMTTKNQNLLSTTVFIFCRYAPSTIKYYGHTAIKVLLSLQKVM